MSRPVKKITPENLKQVETLAGYGLTEAQIAHTLDMSSRTFRRRKNGNGVREVKSEVLSALERGKALAEGEVGKALYHKAVGGDVAAIRWYEMTRAGRTEKQTPAVEIHHNYLLEVPPKAEDVNEWRQRFSPSSS